MDIKLAFGKRLKELRAERGITQEKLAEMIGVETGTIGMIEVGRKATSFKTLEKLAEALDIQYSELFKSDEANTPNALQSLILKETENLDPKTLKYILKSIKDLKEFLE